MPLDPNLPTFDIVTRQDSSGTIVDLLDHSSREYKYAAYQEGDVIYLCGSSVPWLDPATEAHVATMTLLPVDKEGKKSLRLLELLSPPLVVEFKNTASLTKSWEWSFEFENNIYAWRREMVSLLGSERGFTLYVKPADKKYRDDPQPVAIYFPAKKGATVQVLDYNLKRLTPPLDDMKGQEILMVLSLLAFLEVHFSPTSPYLAPLSSSSSLPPLSIPVSTSNPTSNLDPRTEAHLRARDSVTVAAITQELGDSSLEARAISSKGKGKERDFQLPPTRVPSVQRQSFEAPSPPSLDPNEIVVKDEAKMLDYSHRALSLLEDRSLVFVTLIAGSSALAGQTIKLAEEIKRSWYKSHGEELKTFVPKDEEQPTPPPPPASTNLFSLSRHKSYVPPPLPTSLKIYISRMDLGLPNYAPKVSGNTNSARRGPDWRPPIVFSAAPPPPPIPPLIPGKPVPTKAPPGKSTGKITKEEEAKARVLKKTQGRSN